MPIATIIRTLKSFPASQTQVHTRMTGLRTVSWRNWHYFNSVIKIADLLLVLAQLNILGAHFFGSANSLGLLSWISKEDV